MTARAHGLRLALAAAPLFAAFALLTMSVIGTGYVSTAAGRFAALVEHSVSDDGFFRAYFAVIYPSLPYYGALLFDALTGAGRLSSFLLDNFIAASVVAWLVVLLRRKGYSRFATLAFGALFALNPVTLYAATSGQGLSLLLLFGAVLAAGIFRLADGGIVRGTMLAGFGLAGIVLSHPAGLAFALGISPGLAFVMRGRAANEPAALYGLTLFLPISLIGAVVYLNWLFSGDALAFLQTGSLDGGADALTANAWSAEWGGRFFAPLVAAFALNAAVLPVLLWLVPQTARLGRSALFSLFAGSIVAVALATSLNLADHPFAVLACALPGAQLAIARADPARFAEYIACAAFALVAGWAALTVTPSTDLASWTSALGHGRTYTPHPLPQYAQADDYVFAAALRSWGGRPDYLHAKGLTP